MIRIAFSRCAVLLATGALLTSGAASPAASASPPAQLAGARIDVTRIGGADRYEVAAKASTKLQQGSKPVIFLATGENFPDALSAGPATHQEVATSHLLLTSRDHIPQSVADEITRIDPDEVVIVGGRNSISSSVEDELMHLVPRSQISRINGVDRYDVSQKLVTRYFESNAQLRPHIATGANFPDALSAGPAAMLSVSPVLLVPGGSSSIDTPTRTGLGALKMDAMVVVGGEASVSAGIFSDLNSIAPTTRADGIDRYAASLAINQQTFSRADTAYLATGVTFPDALTGGVLAGYDESPLYIVPGTCVPRGVSADFTRLGVQHVVLIGGPASLSDAVAQLTPCP